jgi:hypothetical protein
MNGGFPLSLAAMEQLRKAELHIKTSTLYVDNQAAAARTMRMLRASGLFTWSGSKKAVWVVPDSLIGKAHAALF